jgi:para-aminobenzoate synthetase/4-amino-4-deoxychorismate lyase
MKSAEFERIQAALLREGSVWLESAFCKEHNGGALLFSRPVEVVTLSSPSGLEFFFRTLEEKLAEGFFLAGWLAYEAGYGFEERLIPAPSSQGHTLPPLPLGWFGVYREPERFSTEQVEQLFAEESPFFDRKSVALSGFSFNLSKAEFDAKINTIKEHIAAGNLYQVNFTGRYRFTVTGSPPALFAALRGTQPLSYTAFLNSGGRIIQSFSPELFFRRKCSLIETMPMKGTAPRGRTAEEDRILREGLSRCKKNLAENLMIVDLLRNDLGRICKPGSVEAGELFVTESWPTLHQLVSTIRGEEREGIGLYELFRALYPSGSITGAPKINAMKLIQSLEPEPRGIYTGTIGYITPDRDMVFSVAIRTIELSGNQGVYGSGGGIVWDSDSGEEYRECQLKAKILSGKNALVTTSCPKKQHKESPLKVKHFDPVGRVIDGDFDVSNECKSRDFFSDIQKNFGLFESILWSGSYLWLEEHLKRLEASAISLSIPCDTAAAILLLNQLEGELRQSGKRDGNQTRTRFKVRLSLSFQGAFSVSHELIAVQNSASPLRLCLAGHRVDSGSRLLCHKTTARELYDRYFTLALQKGYDEVLFLNERSEVTEGAISTIFTCKGRQFFTPPLHAGLLNGIFRSYMLSTRPFVSEKTITLDDLLSADTIFIANSVRGLRPVFFTGDHIISPNLQVQRER